MRENIDICYVYNLVDSNGTKLQLRLGRFKGFANANIVCDDRGFRWSFVGSKIPMPVRSYTWFNGFPEQTMLDWLKGNGWALRSSVEMSTGKATVYELPKAEEHSKGNETYELPIHAINAGERALKYAVRMMCDNGNKLDAVSLYRYVHPTRLLAAKDAVDAICLDGKR